MTEIPQLVLDHINLPAARPEWLADWYAENFGFNSKDGFVFAPGVLLVFEKGKPTDYKGNTHFGFRSRANYCGFKTKDPEGNVFEIYWED